MFSKYRCDAGLLGKKSIDNPLRENKNENIRLNILNSNLSQFHSFIDEKDIEEKLAIYNPKFKFDFNLNANPENGIDSVTFFIDEESKTPIKISRGEERIFVWSFFFLFTP